MSKSRPESFGPDTILCTIVNTPKGVEVFVAGDKEHDGYSVQGPSAKSALVAAFDLRKKMKKPIH